MLPLETQAANEIDPADGKEKLKQLCSANEAGAGLDFMKDFFEFERSHELRKVAERRRVVELLNSAFRQVSICDILPHSKKIRRALRNGSISYQCATIDLATILL